MSAQLPDSLGITFVNDDNQKSECLIGAKNVNSMTLSLINDTAKSITFSKASSLVISPPIIAAPNTVFTPEQLAKIVISIDGWMVTPNLTGRYINWTLTPKTDIVISTGSSISVAITQVEITNQRLDTMSFAWSFNWSGVAGVSNGVVPVKTLFLIPQPELADFELLALFMHQSKIQVGGSGDYVPVNNLLKIQEGANLVYSTIDLAADKPVSHLATQFSFSLANDNEKDVKFDTNTAFVFSFVECNDGENSIGALAETKHIKEIVIEVYDTRSQKWVSLHQDVEGIQVQWTWNPGDMILDSSLNSVIMFRASGIYTTLSPYLTPLYVVYSGIPQYKNGSVILEVEKVNPTATVVDFMPVLAKDAPLQSSSPTNIGLGQKVDLSWKTIAISQCDLNPNGHNSVPNIGINGQYSNYIPYQTPTDLGHLVKLTTTPLTTIQNSLQFVLKPVLINSLTANGSSGTVILTEGSKVDLAWSVLFASKVELTDKAGKVIASFNYNDDPKNTCAGKFSYTFPGDGTSATITLTATGYNEKTQALGTVSSALVLKPDLPFSIKFLPDKGPFGTVESTWDLSKYTWDSANFETDLYLNNTFICQNAGKQFNHEPGNVKGHNDYQLTDPGDHKMPDAKLEAKVTLTLSIKGKVSQTFLYSIIFTTKNSVLADLKLTSF